MESPFPCPKTVTVRRNPHRKARPTPSSTVPLPLPLSSPPIPPDIPSFPTQDILSVELSETQRPREIDSFSSSQNPKRKPESENLKVFLRIRPLTVSQNAQKQNKRGGEVVKNAWPKNPKAKHLPKNKVKNSNEICVTVNDPHSVTISPPSSLQESKRIKSVVYEGFSHVFSNESSQAEVYQKLVHPLVEDFLRGKSGMLAALGPTGSGKTHTVFGCIREPGMVPLALRRIFSEDKSNGNQVSRCRTFYLSMFEICSEKGKSERIFDLLQEEGEISIQQSAIKGLNEVTIRHAEQAESLIAHGLLRRATAATNSNSQSSRSQCIINICCTPNSNDGEFDDEPKSTSLTIVDLAGAEREKKTGNQGLRMLESNFINNTSMVFGLCLRSLLEHQKNPKKPLQKHFQNSLLTRYLREYLEGKKRMALVLTLKPGAEDYLETSNLLKQASPYAQIKFIGIEEPAKNKSTKRPTQVLHGAEHSKRMKFSSVEASSISKTAVFGDQPRIEETKDENGSLTEVLVESEEPVSCKVTEGIYIKQDRIELTKREREYQIMVNFAKALWDVLKQYKQNLEMAENEICCLRDNLTCEKRRSSDLEKEVRHLRLISSFPEVPSAGVSSSCLVGLCTGIDSSQEQNYQHNDQKDEKSRTHISIAESSQDLKDLEAVDMHSEDEATSVCIASQDCVKERCEEAAETAGLGQHFQHLKYDEEDHSSVNNIRTLMDVNNVQRDDKTTETEGTDDSEYGSSCLQLCVKNKETCVCSVEEPAISASPVITSCDNSSAVEMDPLPHEEKELHPSATVMPRENASLVEDTRDCTALDTCSLDISSSRKTEKPKRRLLPASSTLLKDIGSVAVEDDIDKPKGARGEKKVPLDTRNKSKGSTSLLRLLRNDLRL
ncbi:kinesin-like protein KIN-6 isoform X1 [Coffea arabica]|uniref:Kinesin-like protein KIN-6 isoform X1 n=1 Tax=Coffea arabica TaxID=13443 RepID=A0A6P6UTM0_COFAR|nr:kinesin-like protein KIN-6 isoform X1 [Coffea arabica]